MRPLRPWRGLALVGALALLSAAGETAESPRPAPPLPRDPARWLGTPQSWEALRGHVTLVFVWTFG